MPRSQSEMGVAEVDGVFYLAGGWFEYDALWTYRPDRDRWNTGGSLPMSVNHLMVATIDRKLYVAAGGPEEEDIPTAGLLVYDMDTESWATLADLPLPRFAASAAVLDGHLYVVGGRGPEARTLLRYDPATDSWTELAQMNLPREHLDVAVVGGKIYAIGGRWVITAYPSIHNTVEVYDPETDEWQYVASMSTPRGGHAAAVLDGKIYVTGGELFPLSREALDSGEVYDPATDTWSPIPSMPVPLHGHGMLAYDGKLWVFGGAYVAGAANGATETLTYEP